MNKRYSNRMYEPQNRKEEPMPPVVEEEEKDDVATVVSSRQGVACPFCKKVAEHPVRKEYPEKILRCFCQSCRREFQTQPGATSSEKRIVEWTPVKCPSCSSTDCPTTSTRENFRYHACRACGQGFRSVEK